MMRSKQALASKNIFTNINICSRHVSKMRMVWTAISMAVRPGRPPACSCWRVSALVAACRVAFVLKNFSIKFQSAS